MNSYKCLKKNIYESEGYVIVPLREEDIYLIMKWRNEQIKVLRQKQPITVEMQQKYYNEVIKPTFTEQYPDQILFSYLYDNKCIGYGGLVHINWQDMRGELSFLVDTERIKNNKLYEKDFTVYLALIKEIAFDDLLFNKLHGETYDIRPLHIKILEDNGFISEGRLKKHIYIDGVFVDALIHGFLKK